MRARETGLLAGALIASSRTAFPAAAMAGRDGVTPVGTATLRGECATTR